MENARYILFMLDSNLHHDGMIFMSYKKAKQYAIDAINDHYCTRFVIGMFTHSEHPEELISMVETYGFKGDKKEVTQMELFK